MRVCALVVALLCAGPAAHGQPVLDGSREEHARDEDAATAAPLPTGEPGVAADAQTVVSENPGAPAPRAPDESAPAASAPVRPVVPVGARSRRFPRALVPRPLLMPARRGELSVSGGLGREFVRSRPTKLYGSVDVSARFAVEAFELFAGGQVVPVDLGSKFDPRLPFWRRLDAGARVRVSDDTAIAAQISWSDFGLGGESGSFGVLALHKARPFKRGAILVGGGLDAVFETGTLEFGDEFLSQKLAAVVVLGVQRQVSRFVGVELLGRASVARLIDEYNYGATYLAFSSGLATVISVSDHLDVGPFVAAEAFIRESSMFVLDRDTVVAGVRLSVR